MLGTSPGKTAVHAVTFDIIPVIDLIDGHAVAARGGRREEYSPVRSPLCQNSEPVSVARALLDAAGADTLYVADLDAIMGGEAQAATVRRLIDALPGVDIWLDGGFQSQAGAASWVGLETVVSVLGSETSSPVFQPASCPASMPGIHGFSSEDVDGRDKPGHDNRVPVAGNSGPTHGAKTVLSLDFDAQRFRGPLELLQDASRWPNTVIVMTLDRVGENQGPDLCRLRQIVGRAGERRVIAAGGVRDMADIEAIADAGAAGALIASALHAKRIGQKEIAAFRGRRRSR